MLSAKSVSFALSASWRSATLQVCGLLVRSVASSLAAQSLSSKLRAGPERVELNGVPFFAQNAYQSAPASLAALLTQQGDEVTPGMVEKELQLPQKEASLREGLAATARQHGLIVYPLGNRLDDLLEQVSAGNPVLVHLREGFGWMPSWRCSRDRFHTSMRSC